jgi:hypothetical protein
MLRYYTVKSEYVCWRVVMCDSSRYKSYVGDVISVEKSKCVDCYGEH